MSVPSTDADLIDVVASTRQLRRDRKSGGRRSPWDAVPALLDRHRHPQSAHRTSLARRTIASVSSFWSAKRVLVTGGSGFLGRVVTAKLVARGAEVIAPRSAEFDLTDAAAADRLFTEAAPDLVVHLAARVGGIGANLAAPADLYLSNLLMGTYVIEAARHHGTPKTVIVGTICSYPKMTPVPFRESSLWDGYPEETNAPYGIAKKALLVHAQANLAQHGQRSIYLMPTNLYGPGDKFHPSVSHVIPALVKKCVDAVRNGDDKVEVWGTGTATREFLYVDDAAEGIVLAAEHHDDLEPVNLGADREVSIREIAETIADYVGFTGTLRWDPTKPDGQPRRRVDASRAERSFGWRSATPLDLGLSRTIDWYRANIDLAEAPPSHAGIS